MSVILKNQEEKNLQILKELLTVEANRYCFDCNQRGATYVNITIGSFVCTNCGGALRKYSHRLKSIFMSNFSQSEMDFIKKRGNNICKKIYYGLCEHKAPPETEIKNGLLDSHLRAKYELKKWYLEPTPKLEEEALVENQYIFDRIARGVSKPAKNYSINSSSIPNSKVNPSLSTGDPVTRVSLRHSNRGPSWPVSSSSSMQTQSPFGDNFLFPPASDSLTCSGPLSKSHTMNFSMPPLVPMSGSSSVWLSSNQAGTKGTDKYAVFAELDDFFTGTGVGSHSRDSVGKSTSSSNPFNANRDTEGPSLNPFAAPLGKGCGEYVAASTNPFSTSASSNSKNPFL